MLVGQACASDDALKFALFLGHVFGNGCCLAGAGAWLYYDGVMLFKGRVVQEVRNIYGIAGPLFPTGWQLIDWIICFVFRDLFNISSVLIQDPSQVIDV